MIVVVQSVSPPPAPPAETKAHEEKQEQPAEPAGDQRLAGHETEPDDRSVTQRSAGERAERAHGDEIADSDRHAAQTETLEPPSGRADLHG